MPQIFHRRTNFISKASIVGALIFAGGLALAALWFFTSPLITKEGVQIEQPVQFSHERHVARNGIDCRYCHTTVETSSFADIPPVHTCMSCHSQLFTSSPLLEPVRSSYRTGEPLEWARVNDLPDFVYFDHEVHIAKGVGCDTCHGEVEKMPLTWKENTLFMAWCLECHREPERFVRPVENVFDVNYEPPDDQLALGRRLVEEYNIASPEELTDCFICHR